MKYIKFAPIAGMLMLATSAFAVEPTADIKVYAAGASAQLNSISGILTSLCQPNVSNGHQIEYYQGFGDSLGASSTTLPNTNLRAFRCTLKNTGTDAAVDGKIILFSYSAIDGSASGVQYVARQGQRKFLNFDACPAVANYSNTSVNAGSAATSITPSGSKQFVCDGTAPVVPGALTTKDVAPVAGASDIEPARFEGDNAPVGETSITGDDIAKLNVVSTRAVLFAVTANAAMWAALQQKQFGSPGATHPAGGINPAWPFMPVTTSAAGVDSATPGWDEKFRPNITRADYTAVAKGDLTDMKSLNGGTSGALVLARRVNGSGTQAMSNIYFLNNPCGNLLGANIGPADATFTGGTFTVTESSTTDEVLAEFQTRTAPTIGVISMEKSQRGTFTTGTGTSAVTKNGYAYLKLDGITPSRAAAIKGDYTYYGEETFQWNQNVVVSGSSLEKFLVRYSTAAGKIATLTTLSSGTQAGTAAIATNNGGLPSSNTTWILGNSRNGNSCSPALRIVE
jgi:hypothetical protein